jgi:hypothetical protein
MYSLLKLHSLHFLAISVGPIPFVLESAAFKLGSFPSFEAGFLPGLSSASDIEPKAVADAKKALADVEHDSTNTKNEITRAAEDLEKDYGLDFIFHTLKGRCVSKESGEYTYEPCFMSQTKQKPKKGGADTNIGNLVSFDPRSSMTTSLPMAKV